MHQIRHLAVRELLHQWQDLGVQDTIQGGDGVETHAFLALVLLRNLTLSEVLDFFNPFTLAHLFSVRWLDIKGRAFQRVLAPAIRAGMGQYFTPDVIVKMMVGIIDPTEKDMILDPFCGSGHFLSSCLEYVRRKYFSTHSLADIKDYFDFAYFHLHGIEKSDRMVRIAMTDMLLHDDGHTNIRNTDALLSFDNYPDIRALGNDDSPQVFDIIVTNPPFGSIADTTQLVGRFTLGRGKKSLPLEMLGLERSLQFLKPGGRLGIVLPDAIVANKSTSWVRDWYHDQAKVVALISLPQFTFVPFGANVKPCILFLRKWKLGEDKSQDYPVYLAEVDNIGYDAALRSTGTDEADMIVQDFHRNQRW
ncbi:putative type I restriction enzymeP M protein [uncultured bacterium]|nr:putative type I restriction enzymeP M protein [uncultured bacterium]